MAGTYVNPGWTNGTSPALEKTNLDALSNAVVENQSDIAALEELTEDYPILETDVSTSKTAITNLKAGTLVAKNVAVGTGAWSADSTYASSGYNWRATATVTGATTDHAPIVNFGAVDALSGNFAPVAISTNNGVYIYAKTKPSATITIGSIICIKQTA